MKPQSYFFCAIQICWKLPTPKLPICDASFSASSVGWLHLSSVQWSVLQQLASFIQYLPTEQRMLFGIFGFVYFKWYNIFNCCIFYLSSLPLDNLALSLFFRVNSNTTQDHRGNAIRWEEDAYILQEILILKPKQDIRIISRSGNSLHMRSSLICISLHIYTYRGKS